MDSPQRPDKRLRTTLTTETSPDSESTQFKTSNPVNNKAPRLGKHHRKRKVPTIEPFSGDDILRREAISLLERHREQNAADTLVDDDSHIDEIEIENAPIATGTEVELVVSELSSTGDSLSVLPEPYKPWVVAVPFALPGERVRARVYRHGPGLSFGDLIRVEDPNADLRDMSRVQCKYFGKCAGCQYQMLSYEEQLSFKRNVVERAYKNYSGLRAELIPNILPTIPSPLQYGYRTKLTPHFDVPPKRFRKENDDNNDDGDDRVWEVRIGFGEKGRRSVMDIEECPIATPVLNAALPSMRADVKKRFDTYKKGATLLLRDSLTIPVAESGDKREEEEEGHVCVTEYHKRVRERVGEYLFEFPAGSFFQNNSSILEPLTSYVRDAIFGGREGEAGDAAGRAKYLVDAYCGSGLFSITLSRYFSKVVGIEISKESIESARHNADLNGIDLEKKQCSFYAGDAEAIFENAGMETFAPELTAVIIDPPRKGCDIGFLKQLIRFGPGTIVYVSCNVHTQSRDLGMILQSCDEYEIKSIRGFDLFPQTAHVESVAVLGRRRKN